MSKAAATWPEAKTEVAHLAPSQSSHGVAAGLQFNDLRPTTHKVQVMQLMANEYVSKLPLPIQQKKNNTGLPDVLKSGIENLSGYAMDDVKVHYNSAKPAQLNAHAYAQGTDIHLASGQEKHLPHEAWHVVQQKQGRVQPTTQLKEKVAINDDESLEKEADQMGKAALQLKTNFHPVADPTLLRKNESHQSNSADSVTQRVLIVDERRIARTEDLDPGIMETLTSNFPQLAIAKEMVINLIIAAIIDNAEEYSLNPETLSQLVNTIGEQYIASMMGGETDGGEPHPITAAMLAHEEAPSILKEKIGSRERGNPMIAGRNAHALNKFFDTNPAFLEHYKGVTNRTVFDSAQAKNLGGLYKHEEREVHLESKVGNEPKQAFLRTIIHEMGHATFQQLLITAPISDTLSKDKLAEYRARVEQIDTQVEVLSNTMDLDADEKRKGITAHPEIRDAAIQIRPRIEESIDKQEKIRIAEEEFRTNLTAEGEAFYNAWKVLRQNEGEHLLGLDLGSVSDAEGRKAYQAETFQEFCAESFMHIALEPAKLAEHVAQIQSNEDLPGAVKEQWRNVHQILLQFKPLLGLS